MFKLSIWATPFEFGPNLLDPLATLLLTQSDRHHLVQQCDENLNKFWNFSNGSPGLAVKKEIHIQELVGSDQIGRFIESF